MTSRLSYLLRRNSWLERETPTREGYGNDVGRLRR
jgi:hypothetical protein